jgi:DNA-directed RNA polymerase specialized sigma24 family protein
LGQPEGVLRRAAPKERDAASFAEAVATLTWRESVGIDVIFEWLVRMGVPLRDRADVVQDVLLRAFTSWPTFAPSRYAMPARRGGLKQSSDSINRRVFARWLNAIAKNAVANYFHAARRYREDFDPDPLTDDAVDANTPTPDARLVRRATRAELAAALRCVPPVWRRAALGSIQQLADRSGDPPSTLYKIRHRAFAELATLLASDPISCRRAQLAALATARRVLCARGMEDAEARTLLQAALPPRYCVTMLQLCRRARALGLPAWSPGPLALAALATRKAAGAHGDRARYLRKLAAEAAETALTRLCRTLSAAGTQDQHCAS